VPLVRSKRFCSSTGETFGGGVKEHFENARLTTISGSTKS
jgi:hypothetical protein